jgi:hypothetical protein
MNRIVLANGIAALREERSLKFEFEVHMEVMSPYSLVGTYLLLY